MKLNNIYNYVKYVLDTPKQHNYVNLDLGEKQKNKREPEVFTFSDEEIYEYQRRESLKKLSKRKKMLSKLEIQRRKRNKSRIKKYLKNADIVDGLDFVDPDYDKRVNLKVYKHNIKTEYYKYVLHVEECSSDLIKVDTSIFTTHDIKRNLINMTPKRFKR